MRRITHDEFLAELRAQGVPREDLAFVCPACGTIQSARDLIEAGAGQIFDDVQGVLGFSCVGRWTHKSDPTETIGKQTGCNWTLGGFLHIHELEVVIADGQVNPRFEPATPKQAVAHARRRKPKAEKPEEAVA